MTFVLRMIKSIRWNGLEAISDEDVHADPLSDFHTKGEFATTLELDINTAPDFSGRIEGDNLTKVFHELVQLAQERTDKEM